MDIRDINIVGVLGKAVNNDPKTTCFVFDSVDASLYGLVYFTGAYWQVRTYQENIEHSLKMKLRVKVQRAKPDNYNIINDPIFYFSQLGRDIKLATSAQQQYIIKLINSCPAKLYAEYASEIISIYKLYDSIVIKEDMLLPFKSHYIKEKEEIIKHMTDFVSHDYSSYDQFDFMKSFGVIAEKINHYFVICKEKPSFN